MSTTPFLRAFSRRAAIVSLTCVLCAGAFTGCASSRKMGDRALQEKRYTEALDFYELEIAEGSRDPELYYNAAQASLYEGDLGGAERYYSRSIKYGGGLKVMRALAQLYIQTSNYARAAQVLYELLRLDPDQQTIYGNLGTALLYSGQPSEAESYLLIAQQLDPKDPLPYINLAVIYDRYLTDPAKSAAFYNCYAQLAPPSAPNHAIALTRSQELQERAALLEGEAFPLRCGEVYVPGDYNSEANRRAKLEALKRQAQEEDRQLLLLENPEDVSTPVAPGEPIKIEKKPDGPGANEPVATTTLAPAQIQQVEAALLSVSRDMSECKEILAMPSLKDALPELSAPSLQVAASCYQALAEPQHAERVWLMVLQKKPSPLALGSLLQLMDSSQRKDEVRSLCEEYAPYVETLSAVQKCQEAR